MLPFFFVIKTFYFKEIGITTKMDGMPHVHGGKPKPNFAVFIWFMHGIDAY